MVSTLNLNRLKKDEIVWLGNHKCQHSHNYLEHYSCFLKESPKSSPLYERIGFLDIEASNLNSDFGIVFSYCIKEKDGKIIGRSVTEKEMRSGVYDKNLLKECNDDIRKFDRIIGYYSTKFDIPYLRTRSIFYKLDFPVYGEVKHTDLYYMVKSKLNLHRKRLETCCDFFGIPSKNHPLRAEIWFKAMSGDKKALNFIFTHNKEDVVSTEQLYNRIVEYSYPQNKSI